MPCCILSHIYPLEEEGALRDLASQRGRSARGQRDLCTKSTALTRYLKIDLLRNKCGPTDYGEVIEFRPPAAEIKVFQYPYSIAFQAAQQRRQGRMVN